MKLLSVNYGGHEFFIVDHGGRPFVPLTPICKAFGLDRSVCEWTAKKSLFRAETIQVIGIDGATECLCLPLRKLLGWLINYLAQDMWRGLDDALYDAWVNDRYSKFPVSGRVLLTLNDGHVDDVQHVPDDWLVAPLERFHTLSVRAGYRVTHDSIHKLMYDSRI